MAVMKLADDELNNVSGGAAVAESGFPKVMRYCPYCKTTHEVTEVSGGRFTCGNVNQIFTGTDDPGAAVAATGPTTGTVVAKSIGGKTMSGTFRSDVLC